jgi:tetratricopeptide (TPR) repeat protein
MMLDQDRYWDCLDQAVEASSGGRTEEALAWLDEALRANPRGAEAHNGRGEILWDAGRYEDALREFDRSVAADAELWAGHLNRIEILVEEFGEYEEALEVADELLAAPLEGSVEAEIYYLKAKALFYLDDLDGALFLLRRAIQTNGEVGVYRAFEGQILFEMGSFQDSEECLERARALDPEGAHTLYHLALVYEHRERREEAEGLFVKAAQLSPDLYPLPVRLDSGDFKAAAEDALQNLPATIRGYVKNCPILIEDLPDGHLVRQENVSPQVLGLFVGAPHSVPEGAPWNTDPSAEPTRILLFKRNLEKVAQSHDQLVEQIQITVKHEIGHYLGLDDDELDRLGLA